MIIYCEKCGAPYNQFFFCERCGHMLGEEEIKAHNDDKNALKSENDRDEAYKKIIGENKSDFQNEYDNMALIIILSAALLLLGICAVLLFQS
ncbi:MAG: hypothetical protein IKM72_00195 [Oscillospiraceae bacterium]|nr:hypothetical protein [Oscillospiraceae bacterium]